MLNKRINEIDLLRFISAVFVVFFHYSFRGYAADSMTVMPYTILSPFSRYGYLGVEMFFMISGFVILMTAENENLRGFLISRMVRLYPAFWACCTLTFIVIVVYGLPRYSASGREYLANMTLMGNILKVPPMDGAYWSLFVEIRFYALVAAVLIIGKIHQMEKFMLAWLAISVALEAFPVEKLYVLFIVDYSAYFIAGATYFLIWSKGFSFARIAVLVVSWGMAVFQAVGNLTDFDYYFHISTNAFAVAMIVTSFFAVMLLIATGRTGFFREARWLKIGALTYPLYLLHENIGFITFNHLYHKVNVNLIFWGTVLLMLILAHIIHKMVEKPLSRVMKKGLNSLADRSGLKPAVRYR